MSWLDCTTRPPGYYGGGPGPGGGGDGDGGCIGNGCDDDGNCFDREYFRCDVSIPECISKYFSPQDMGNETCTFSEVFTNDEGMWHQGECPEWCQPVECTFFICEGDGDPSTANPCTMVLSYSNSPDMIACGGTQGDYTKCPPAPTCLVQGKTGYKGMAGKAACEAAEPDCKGAPGEGEKCWQCPTDDDKECCEKECDFKYDEDIEEWVCPEVCYEDATDCDDDCKAECWECEFDDDLNFTGNCVPVMVHCGIDSCQEVGKYEDNSCTDPDTGEGACTKPVCDECTRYSCIEGCDPMEFGETKQFEDCVLEETVWSDGSECLEATKKDSNCSKNGYKTNNGFYATKQEALANCISCEDAWKCEKSDSEFDDTCEKSCTDIKPEFFTGGISCNLPTDCWETDDDCYENGCDCPSYVVCPACIVEWATGKPPEDPACYNCVTCSPLEERDENDECQYPEESLCDELPGLTCQSAIKGEHSYGDCQWKCGPKEACSTATQACETNCNLDNKCWECSDEDDCECTQTCSRIGGECPTDCYEKPDLCEPTCMQTCWECVEGTGGEEVPGDGDDDDGVIIGPGGEADDTGGTAFGTNVGGACKEIKIPCGDPCNSAGYHDSKDACQDACDTTENSFNDNDNAIDLVYKYNYVDSVYERNLSNQKYPQLNTPFTPVNKGSLPDGIFRRNVHASIYATNAMNNASGMLFSDFPYSDITNAHLEQSLDLELVSLLNEVKLATGESIKRRVYGMIRNLIISNRLHTLDLGELKGMLKSIKAQQDKYPNTRGTYSLPGTHASEAQALKLAGDKAWDISPDSYRGSAAEKMKLWKTIATDLDKSIPVRLSDGSLNNLYYSVSDTIPLETSGTLTISPGDVQKVGDSYLTVSADYGRGRILQLEDLQKVCNLLGQEYSFTMNVKTDEAIRLDERYGVSGTRKDFYMLTLEPSSINDLNRDNPFVAKTKVKYKYETDGPARNDWVEYRPWPYMVFYVDADDPIFNYITNDGEINITSTDFVTDLFEDDPNMMRFIRRLPWTVVLIPSDKTNNVPSHVISTQKAYGERELKFLVNPDPQRSDKWDPPHLREHHSYPGPGVNPSRPDINALYYSVYTDKLNGVNKYTNEEPTLPRPTFGMRDVLSTLKDLKDNYILNGRAVNWPQVYETVPRSKMKNLFQEVPDWESFKTKAAFGKISTIDSVNENYPKVRDVRSNNKGIRDTNLNTYYKAEKLPDSQVSPPPGPLE